ncbi:tyrosine-type recombinase/integrase [Gottfriedia solisilvae]|uniref:Tyrosine recombinase XerC n=1 Tax=Gottfriedia solisilvae TaxID=1516104 RepID=A0A8J3ADZ1_9BACI|nr:tyrosine-type recombinase/integrase [Gottfriedia solisilvae]GGI12567.1 tyrosine recombinase XerC [Gottfriedia solisilvae]
MLVIQAIDEFLLYLDIEKKCSPNTIQGYTKDLLLFNEYLKEFRQDLDIANITRATVRRFVQYQMVHKHSSSRSMNRRISSLRSFTKFCLLEKYISDDFMATIERPKINTPLPIYMNLQELQQLFLSLEHEAFGGSYLSIRNHFLFKFIALTGTRRQEVCDLTWKQFDLMNQTVRIRGKGNKERLLPLHPTLLPLIHAYKDVLKPFLTHSNLNVFYNHHYHSIDPRGLHKVFKEVLKKAGLDPKRFSLHHLRHTFATLMLQENGENIDLRVLQDFLGHESLATTSIYTHVDFKQKQKAINTFLSSKT